MARNKLKALSTPVRGMRRDMEGWVETGLMVFSTEYLKASKFCEQYDWEKRTDSPTPEAVIGKILGNDVKLMGWKGMRGDRGQITPQNVLDLDWVTHCKDAKAYDAFLADCLAPPPPPAPPAQVARPVVKLNLGCGDNKLPGWSNHDMDVDITRRLPWPDNTADYIFCEHCVEHIPYRKAIEFFKECLRVLRPGGVVRITVPSMEQIYESEDPGYWKFTTKFQPNATKRGALHNIIYGHGHEMVWTRSILMASIYYAGFEGLAHCPTHKSAHPALTGVEGHHKVITEPWNQIESLTVEGTKPGGLAKPQGSSPAVAVIVGGGSDVSADVDSAMRLLDGRPAHFFVINDQIPVFPGDVIAVSLHPEKMANWLALRAANGLPPPLEVWCHKPGTVATHHTEDWSGSSGLFATKIARQKLYEKILLCGVPMRAEDEHFVRHVRWNACKAFQRAWEIRKEEIKPYVRSFGGWTAQLLGYPDDVFLSSAPELKRGRR